MRSLRSRLLLVILTAILINSLLIAASAFWGAGIARREWKSEVTEESARRLAAEVERLWEKNGRLTVSGSRDTFDRVTRYTDELAAFAVYDADKVPVYYWRNQAYPGLSPQTGLNPRYAVLSGGKVIGWVACLPSDFYFISANRSVALQMTRTLMAGTALSIAAAVALSNWMSRRAVREARETASLLERLQKGERSLPFPRRTIAEFQTIVRAAAGLQEALLSEEEQRRQWTRDIAHDLKTPVAALQAQMEAVRDGVFELTPERFSALEAEFRQIDSLVSSLSLLARVESPRMTPELADISAGPFLEQIRARFTESARAAGLELDCIPPSEPLLFPADPDLLTRAVNNLVQNAVQHSRGAPPGSRVTVTITAEGDSVAITVENPGRIGDEHLSRLFQRLYRGDFARSGPGSGLGLAIVRAVADKLGGSATARNTPRGTVRMRLLLPLRRP